MGLSGLLALARLIDAVNDRIGRAVAWLALAMVLMQFVVVVMRYIFGVGSLYMQEGIVYLHAIVFLVAAGYTLLHDGHVRVDIVYGSATPRPPGSAPNAMPMVSSSSSATRERSSITPMKTKSGTAISTSLVITP